MRDVNTTNAETSEPARTTAACCVNISRDRSIERRMPGGECPGKGIRRRHRLRRKRRRTFVS